MKKFEDNKNKEQYSTPYDVLIISDDPTTIRLITSYFEMSEYTCKGFDSDIKALKYMETNLPRIILMDEILHDTSGFELLRKLKSDERLKDVPINFFLEKDQQKYKKISKKKKKYFNEDVFDFYKF